MIAWSHEKGTHLDNTGYLEHLSETCAKLKDSNAVWQAALEFFHAHDIAMVSYHHIDPGQPAGNYVTIQADGFPDAWVCEYVGDKLYLIDPIPELAARLAKPFRWSEIRQMTDVTPAHERYLAAMERADLGDGLAIQVFGPSMRNGYFGLGLGEGVTPPGAAEVLALQCAAQLLHLRYCEVADTRMNRSRGLSPREKEILEWMARGKSNAVIADILGVSRHTVDTLARRMFEKLDVNDRTTAVIRGLGSGLLQYQQVS